MTNMDRGVTPRVLDAERARLAEAEQGVAWRKCPARGIATPSSVRERHVGHAVLARAHKALREFKELNARVLTDVHSLTANQNVGLTVYGYGQFTSYMYPGGADLARIALPIGI